MAEKTATCLSRIAAAFQKHVGLDLEDAAKCGDPERFADLVEVACRNFNVGLAERRKKQRMHQQRGDGPKGLQLSFAGRRNQRANKVVSQFLQMANGGKVQKTQRSVRLSLTGQSLGVQRDNDIAAAFLRMAGDGDEQATAEAFLKMAES